MMDVKSEKDRQIPRAAATEPGAVEERRQAAWIGKALLVRGDIVSTQDLVINGEVEGTIELGDHSLIIGTGASVTADLVAKDVTISGTVKGNVTGHGSVVLRNSASVEGDIIAPRFTMEEGALLRGRVDTRKPLGTSS
jgi:cytoskeletal protein CcmA (bactofilin family)